jgi:hypothetical protein
MNAKRVEGLALAFALLMATGAYPATTIDIGDAIGHRTGDVWVPVEISADTDIAGVNLRIEYDPGILTLDTILPQKPPLGNEHLVLWHSPEPGKLNAVVYAPAGPAVLARQPETLLFLLFNIQADVPDTTTSTDIAFAAAVAGPPGLPGSGLSDSLGNSVPHAADGGSVQIETAAGLWDKYE